MDTYNTLFKQLSGVLNNSRYHRQKILVLKLERGIILYDDMNPSIPEKSVQK